MSPNVGKSWHSEEDWGEPVYLRSSFFGRERDLAALDTLIGIPGTRLITITGPSGVGKSRFAAQFSAHARKTFPDGAVFVPLSGIRDPEFVLPFLAESLDLRDDTDRPVLERLYQRLDGSRMLLVLDEFEHVLAASRVITEFLGRVRGPVVLVTSRTPLRISAEHEYLLAPLDIPSTDMLTMPDVVKTNAAIALFVDRARAVRNTFELTEDNIEVIAEICRRLDGLPLAIELAAARTKILSPRALLARLSNRFQVLTGGPRDAPPRSQTMRDAIAWSFDLLSPDQQALFRRLCVFTEGFGFEEAAGVVAEPVQERTVSISDDQITSELFETIASLVDSSMLLAGGSNEMDARFYILETLREFGLEQLETAGEQNHYRYRHARIFDQLARTANEQIWGPESYRWIARLQGDYANLRAALEWSIANEPSIALRLAGNLWWFWQSRGYLGEGRIWLQRALDAAPYEANYDRLQTAFGSGFLAVMQGDPSAALPYLDQCRQIAHDMGTNDPRIGGRIAFLESFILGGLGEHREAVAAARNALLAVEAATADSWIPFVHNRLGIELAAIGEHEDGEAQFRLALEGWREQENEWGEVTALINLAIAARNRGDYAKATADLRTCLAPAHRQGDPWGEIETRSTLAGLAALLGNQRLSIRFQASAEQIRRAIDLRLQDYIDPALVDHASIEERMRDPIFASDWAERQTASITQLIDWANELQQLAESRNTVPQARERPIPLPVASRAPGSGNVLTPRELEVLRLMAEGLSSKEIGEQLFISPRTASTHVANIFGKLSVDNRAAAVSAGFRLGLI